MCFGDNAIIITEGRLDREDSAGIKFILLDDTTEHVEFNFTLPSQESSPFGLYEVGNKVFCSDHGSHCVFELNINSRDVLVVAGRLDANGTDDGPVETAYICSPSGLASRGECLYFAEHPLDKQGAIRVLYSLEGLANFQAIWQGISQSMGMVFKLHAIRDKDEAGFIKNKSLVDAFPEIKDFASDLEIHINSTKQRFGENSLDIRNGSMPSKTAAAVTKTLIEGFSYLIEYFKYIERQDILDEIRVKVLNDRLAEAFFGHISEKIEGNNPSCLKLCKRVATEAFHFLQSAVSSREHTGVTIRRLRDSDPLTYTYNLDEGIEVDLLWKLFFKRHEESFATADLSRAKQALAEGEEIDCSKMFYVGTTNGCVSFVSKLLPSNDGEEEKAAIRAIHMTIKSRPMRKLRDLQKRKYGTPPTILGQHAFREEMNILPISGSVLDIQEDSDVDDNATNAVEEVEGEEVYIFTEGEVVVFRGTDDLKFNLMLVTKNLRRDKTNLKTKICGNFLLEHEQDEEFYRFVEDKDWMNAKMALPMYLEMILTKLLWYTWTNVYLYVQPFTV